MSCTLRRKLSRRLLERVLVPALTAFAAAFAHGQPAPTSIVFAINEGGSGNADAADILFRYQEFGEVVEKALRVKVSIVNARGRDRLKENLKNHSYGLLLARPNDVPAEAVRDFGYQPVVSAKESVASAEVPEKWIRYTPCSVGTKSAS